MARGWRIGLPVLLLAALALGQVADAGPALRPVGGKWRGAEVAPPHLAAGFERYRAITRRVRGASRENPGALRVRRAGSAAGLSILRVDLVGDRPAAGRRPRVLVVGGLHAGNETVGAETATRFIEAAAGDADLRNQFDITVVPLANPTALVLGIRENAEGADVNRSFADGKWTAESRAIRAIAEEGDFAGRRTATRSRRRSGSTPTGRCAA
jgi:hypothetical protein